MRLPRGSVLVVASHNEGKVREIKALLGPHGIEPLSARRWDCRSRKRVAPLLLPMPNSRPAPPPMPAIIRPWPMIPGFGSCPEWRSRIYSARWAGPTKDFRIAMARIEKELKKKNATDLSAKFVCVLSIAMPHGEMRSFEGEVHGTLTFPPRGEHGFGYDPIFIPDGGRETFGEIDPHIKTR